VRSDDDAERLRECLETLEALIEDRGRLLALDDETRVRLIVAAGRVSRPERAELRRLAKARRNRARRIRREADEQMLAGAGIRALRRAPIFPTPPPSWLGASDRPPPALAPPAPPPSAPASPAPAPSGEEAASSAGGPRELRDARRCYVCRSHFREVHDFYDQMCPACAALNWERRHRVADLSGRVALVTGARVKIGYQAAIKLLRAGAHVVVTTRFARDAAQRYAREADFEQWRERLQIHGLDLRHTPSVELLCEHLDRTLPRLDFILNNACQTVRRPPGYYRHLVEAEGAARLEGPAQRLLESDTALRERRPRSGSIAEAKGPAAWLDPVALSQAALLAEELGPDRHLFPEGLLDADLQQIDLRRRNSWRLQLHEVPTVELLEVQLVNAIAPYVLNGRLRALMCRSPERDKHIVNVSAMEGQFYRQGKTDRHPHTNMAKAALNMMTRTSAADYVQDGIHMNSVDTGWITDEDPIEIAERKTAEQGFHPPLDVIDGAARIVDPIFEGFEEGEHLWGLFLKDYRPIAW